MFIRPPALLPGDTIGIVAPASAAPDPKAIDRGADALEKLGFKIKLAPNVRKCLGYLAGSDRERASDLMRMFLDKKVRGIVCVRGGYGTARLLPLLDYKLIRANAKIFVGYSDITSLHGAFLTKANLISFHGPMLNSDFACADMPEFTRDSFLRTLGSLQKKQPLSQGYRGKTVAILRSGIARGTLVGGNLSLLCTLIGTPWQPSFRNCILFLEDVGERPYRFDRMLTHLLNCGVLKQVAGIAVGINADCESSGAKIRGKYHQTLEDVLRERLLPLKIPVITGLPFGHVPMNATIPVGVKATLDAGNGELFLNEPGVSTRT